MGTFLTQRGMLQMTNGQIVSPTEFERMAGKAASKKWKASIRIDKASPIPDLSVPIPPSCIARVLDPLDSPAIMS